MEQSTSPQQKKILWKYLSFILKSYVQYTFVCVVKVDIHQMALGRKGALFEPT